MKIISGSVRGKTLFTLEGINTRPTTSRVKESIFNIAQFYIQDANVLDLFAGSGQMSLEAISRGAKNAVLVDNNKNAVKIIEKNIKVCGFEKNTSLITRDYIDFLKSTKEKFDIIFLDPPYGGEITQKTLNLLYSFDILSKNGIIICESAFVDEFEIPTGYEIQKIYKYGTIKITTVKNKGEL